MPQRKARHAALMTTREAAAYLGISESTLEKLRSQGEKGPRFATVVGSVRYRLADLDDWVDRNIDRSVRERRRRRRDQGS